jgi:bacillithiol system protein YtxJ
MIHWKALTSLSELQDLIRDSYHTKVLIFKHSTRCSVSTIAKMRLEDQWHEMLTENPTVYLLDVIADRDLSRQVAQKFEVYHESPQILLIRNGECTHDASHFDITVDELKEVF